MAYSDKNPSNDGNQYRTTGVDISVCSEGGFEVGSVFAGEWLEYTVEIASAGSYTIEARVASAGAGGSFHIEFDGVNKTGAISVPNTGAWSSYRTAAKTAVSLSAGRQVMRIAMDSNGQTGAVGNFNYIRILRPAFQLRSSLSRTRRRWSSARSRAKILTGAAKRSPSTT